MYMIRGLISNTCVILSLVNPIKIMRVGKIILQSFLMEGDSMLESVEGETLFFQHTLF